LCFYYCIIEENAEDADNFLRLPDVWLTNQLGNSSLGNTGMIFGQHALDILDDAPFGQRVLANVITYTLWSSHFVL